MTNGFIGVVETQWIDDGKKMRLLKDFFYIDSSGKKWTAPKNIIIDGASIPRFFWRIIGSPFVGKYRYASILHDSYYTSPRGESKVRIDLMFYDAMLFSGVPKIKAYAMYLAVKIFGHGYFF